MEKSVSPASTVYLSTEISVAAPAMDPRGDSDEAAADGIAAAGGWPAGAGSSGIQLQQPDSRKAPATIRHKRPAL